MEMVLELLSEGRKIIVFSQFTSMLDLIRTRFDAERIRYSLLTGETGDRRVRSTVFRGGARDVFLISLKAGGVGLNLTAADTVVIFDPWWNPAVEEQAIDRAHRMGQDKAGLRLPAGGRRHGRGKDGRTQGPEAGVRRQPVRSRRTDSFGSHRRGRPGVV